MALKWEKNHMSGSYPLKTETGSKQFIAQTSYFSPITKVVEFLNATFGLVGETK